MPYPGPPTCDRAVWASGRLANHPRIAAILPSPRPSNASENPFQSSIFTQDVNRALHAAREVRANAYMVNDLTAFRVDWMPFGGRKNAGLGLGGTDHGVHEMTAEKLIALNLVAP